MQPRAWPAGLRLAPGNGVIMRKFLGLESEPMKLVILIPAYNEGEAIGLVINTLPKSLPGITEIIPLVVDDGSKDNTAAVAADAGAMVVRHPYNHGLGKAFSTGLTKALELGADVLVNIDADGQFNPHDIQALLDPILSGRADFVSGDRFSKIDGSLVHPEYMSRIKFWGNQRMSALVSMLARRRFVDVSCGFRAYSREAMLRLNLTGSFTYTQESFLDLANKGLVIETVPVDVRYYPERQSKMAGSILKYAWQTVKIIFRAYRDYSPLRFFGVLGVFPGALGIVLGLFVMVHYLLNGAFTPYKAVGLAAIYLVSLAIILWIVGLLADMFVRVRLNQEKILYYEKSRKYFGE